MTVQDHTSEEVPSLEGIAARAKPGVGQMFDRLLAHRTNAAFGWGFEAHQDLCKRAFEEYRAGVIGADELERCCTRGEV